MKLSNLKYPEFMQTVLDYHLKYWNGSICQNCGGLGIVPIMCCNGHFCGCQGKPVDFDFKCTECGRDGPEEICKLSEIVRRLEMDHNELEHEAAAFKEFWLWKDDQGIGTDEGDWKAWWECFWAGYKYASLNQQADSKDQCELENKKK